MPKKKRPSAAASANVDLGALEAELNSLVAEEDLYWTQNAAKFRAVEQTASYDEFQNIVKVCLIMVTFLASFINGKNVMIRLNVSAVSRWVQVRKGEQINELVVILVISDIICLLYSHTCKIMNL